MSAKIATTRRVGDFSIEPGKPYVARYRFVVGDGNLKPGEMNAAWSAYCLRQEFRGR